MRYLSTLLILLLSTALQAQAPREHFAKSMRRCLDDHAVMGYTEARVVDTTMYRGGGEGYMVMMSKRWDHQNRFYMAYTYPTTQLSPVGMVDVYQNGVDGKPLAVLLYFWDCLDQEDMRAGLGGLAHPEKGLTVHEIWPDEDGDFAEETVVLSGAALASGEDEFKLGFGLLEADGWYISADEDFDAAGKATAQINAGGYHAVLHLEKLKDRVYLTRYELQSD